MEKTEIDYLLINEIFEDYLDHYSNFPYVMNLEFYAKKIHQITSQLPISKEDKKYANELIKQSKTIPFLEGIDLVTSYLNHLDPELEKEFFTQLNQGLIEISYVDEASLEDDWYTKRNKRSENNTYVINGEYTSLTNVANKKTNFDLFATIVHEFFHSTNIRDKHNCLPGFCREMLGEFISIYFEFDFLHYVIEQCNYDKDICLTSYIVRYADTILDSDELLDETILLLKKQHDGVLDEYSYKLSPVSCTEKTYHDIMRHFTDRFKNYNEKYQKNNKKNDPQEEAKIPMEPHIAARYKLGAPLAYYLASVDDKTMSYKMLDLNAEINTLSLTDSLRKIGLKSSDIDKLDYGKIMADFKNEIIEISEEKEEKSSKKQV